MKSEKQKWFAASALGAAAFALGMALHTWYMVLPPPPEPAPVPTMGTVSRGVLAMSLLPATSARESALSVGIPILDDCPPGVEVSYRVVDGKMIVDMPFDELETQLRAKVLCHIGNQLTLLDYIATLEKKP